MWIISRAAPRRSHSVAGGWPVREAVGGDHACGFKREDGAEAFAAGEGGVAHGAVDRDRLRSSDSWEEAASRRFVGAFATASDLTRRDFTSDESWASVMRKPIATWDSRAAIELEVTRERG